LPRAEHDELSTQLKGVMEKHRASAASVAALTAGLATAQESLDELKEDMEGRENSATDTSPLVNIKQALVSIKGDVQTFDLRIGVISHTLMQAKLKAAKTKAAKRGRKGKESKVSAVGDDDDDDGRGV